MTVTFSSLPLSSPCHQNGNNHTLTWFTQHLVDCTIQPRLPREMIYLPCCLVGKLCLTLLRPHGLYPTRLLCPWDFPCKYTGVGCHFLLQGIFLSQELNPCLLHWQADSLPLSHMGSPVLFLGAANCFDVAAFLFQNLSCKKGAC